MLEEERSHGEALDSRLGQLTGFAGIILTLTAPLGAEHLRDDNGALFDLFYIGSVTVLAASALLAVTVGLRTRIVNVGDDEVKVPWRRRIGIEPEVLDQFGGALTGEATAAVEKKMIETTVAGIKDQRELNGLKGEVLRFVSFGVAVALLAVAGQAFMLVI